MRVRHTIIDTLFKMNEELRYKKIGNICDVKTGKLDANASDENGAYPFFTCSKEPLRINTYSYDAECVLIAGNGELNVKYYNGKFDAYQRTYILTTKNGVSDVSTQYLYLFFQLYVETLRKNSIGGVIKYIKLGDITEANIPVPPLPTQSRIVSELDLLQSIIDKQKAQLKELDNLAQAIFYDMFGDPVENEKGWEVKSLNDVCDVRDGTHDSPKYIDGGDYILITSKNIVDGKIDYSNINYITKEDYDAINKRSKVDDGDIIMAMIGTIGKPIIVKMQEYKFCIKNVALIKFYKESTVSNIYIKALLSSSTFSQHIISKNQGGTQKFVALGTIRKLSIPIPPLSLQQSFAQKVESIERQKELINQSIREAQTLFDSRMEYYFGE